MLMWRWSPSPKIHRGVDTHKTNQYTLCTPGFNWIMIVCNIQKVSMLVSEFLHTEIENNQSFNFCTSVHTCFSNPSPKEFLLKVHTPYKMQVRDQILHDIVVSMVCAPSHFCTTQSNVSTNFGTNADTIGNQFKQCALVCTDSKSCIDWLIEVIEPFGCELTSVVVMVSDTVRWRW